MRVFISSVRRGLEEERDALPSLIRALGHEPVRFEDFSAQSAPSREACINGVESSDVYLLLLGPNYGQALPETGQSPTHDEWSAATRIGMPRYVFRKTGVDFDEEQQQFEARLGDYASGRFYKAFSTTAELQQAVVAVLQEAASAPPALSYEPVAGTLPVRWLQNGSSNNVFTTEHSLLEVHIVPVEGRPISSRLLDQVLTGLPAKVRQAGLATEAEALHAGHGPDDTITLSCSPPTRRGGFHEVRQGSLAAVTIHKDGETIVTFQLPRDQLGVLLDANDVAGKIESALRLVGRTDISQATRVALAVGLPSTSMMSIGTLSDRARNGASVRMSSVPVRISPDETLSRAAFDQGAKEVAVTATKQLLRAFQSTS